MSGSVDLASKLRIRFCPMAKLVALSALIALFAVGPVQADQWVASPGTSLNAPGEGRRAVGGLPDGRIASRLSGDITKAWYTQPTRRYRHGILGDSVEAAGLKVKLRNGKTLEMTLPSNQVFEDRTPRLVALDRSGKNQIVTLLSSVARGASIAVYGVRNGSIALISKTPYVGRSNRWRNIAGIADFNGDGYPEIVEVVTPHIGGTLKFWTWRSNRLQQIASTRSFSNHAIGSREQRLSAVADFDRDGLVDLAVPSSDRRALVLVGFARKGSTKLRQIARINLPASINRPVVARKSGGKTSLTVGLSNGSVWNIKTR